MIRGESREEVDLGPNRRESAEKSSKVVWHAGKVSLEQRGQRNGYSAACY